MKTKLLLIGAAALACAITGVATGSPFTGLLAAVMVAAGAIPVSHALGVAKSGIITDNNIGSNLQVRAIAESDPFVATVGATLVAANRASDAETLSLLLITNNLADRQVIIGDPTDTDVALDELTGQAGMVLSAQLTFDGGELNGAPMTNTVANGTGLSTVINAALAPAKPSFNTATIINKIEDLVLATEGATDAVVVVDQLAGTIKVFTASPANALAGFADAVASLTGNVNMIAGFNQDATPAASATGQFGE